MSEITLSPAQLDQAARVLWNYGQFRSTRQAREPHDSVYTYRLVCDDDDIHEYLSESGMIKQDHSADTDKDPDSFQWLSNESMDKLYELRVFPSFLWH